MMNIFQILVLSISFNSLVHAQLAGECASLCNDLRTEVLTLEMCREAKKTLPKPKVGDFCTMSMEQGFSDACVAICMGETPVSRIAQTCRAASIEMPRPTVRRWCEHGYNQAFNKARRDLANHFRIEAAPEAPTSQEEPVREETVEEKMAEVVPEPVVEPESPVASATEIPEVAEEAQVYATTSEEPVAAIEKKAIATIPITLDEEEIILTVFEGQTAEDAVVSFCRENVADDVAACIRQLLPTVLEKLEASGI